ncbi:hypothetical protein ACNJ7E_01165 [Rhodococcus sp. NM-2]|uniref:hypothetical protein n=1 Tax=Rhodococcus sp. NM-2 TaxID=3401174 RepID=UPI003AAA8729
MSTTAAALGGELARIGLTVPTDQLEVLLTERVAAVAEQMHITERTARQYFDHDTLRTLARDLALIIKDEAPGADLLALPRTTAMPLATLGATIAALVEVTALGGADKDPDEPATAMALISTLGVLARDHDGDLPAVWVPEPRRGLRLPAVPDRADTSAALGAAAAVLPRHAGRPFGHADRCGSLSAALVLADRANHNGPSESVRRRFGGRITAWRLERERFRSPSSMTGASSVRGSAPP